MLHYRFKFDKKWLIESDFCFYTDFLRGQQMAVSDKSTLHILSLFF